MWKIFLFIGCLFKSLLVLSISVNVAIKITINTIRLNLDMKMNLNERDQNIAILEQERLIMQKEIEERDVQLNVSHVLDPRVIHVLDPRI